MRCAAARRLALVLFVAIGLAGAVPAAAQDDPFVKYAGRTIASIELRVEKRAETSPTLLALVDIKPGEPLTREAVRRVIDRLAQVPRFIDGDVRALVEDRPGGLALIFELTPRHPISDLEVTGNAGMPPAELELLIREEFGGLPALSRLSEVETTVLDLLEDEGYRAATAKLSTREFHDPESATLVIAVEAGPRTLITSLEIRGESPYSDEQIRRRLGVAINAPYRPRQISTELARLREELREKEFYTAIAQDLPPVFNADETGADVVITVNAGPRVRLVVDGRLPGSEDEFIPIRRLGSADTDLLDDAREQIRRELQRRGYWRAQVGYTPTTPTPDELVITYTIDWGRRFRVAGVDVPAGLNVTKAELETLPALKPGAVFNPAAVENALTTIRASYQLDGFHAATLAPVYDEVPGPDASEGRVVIVPNITEGPKAAVTRIDFDLGEQPQVTRARLEAVMLARAGRPFVLGHLVQDPRAIEALYHSLGYLSATVAMAPAFNEARTEAVLTVTAREGPRVVVGEILIVGNERLSSEAIRREILVQPGQPYNESVRFDTQRRLRERFGLRSVRVTTAPRLAGETEVPLIVAIEEAGAFTLGYGGGAEIGTRPRATPEEGIEDRLELAPRAFIELGRRNIGGRNRSLNFFGRLGFKRDRSEDDPAQDSQFGFVEYRVSGTYREQYAFGRNGDLLFTTTAEQTSRTNYNYVRRSATAEWIQPTTPRLTVTGRYALEFTRLFDALIPEDDQSLIDRLFPQVRLSLLSGAAFYDRRNDRLSPTRGFQLSAIGDVALRPLGSEVGFIKGFFEGSIFRSLSARHVLAGRAQFGGAHGFERTVPLVDENDAPILNPDGTPAVGVVRDLPASQRFFAGGSTSVRGFQPDRLGVREILNDNGLSDGGNGMVVFNTELRTTLGNLFRRRLSSVVFLDAGNVFDRPSEIDLSRLRAAVGFGFRYDSPIGPVRLDLGYKLDRFVLPRYRERRWEIHLSLGEVF
jgi:outer membrane protein insertion porin family